MFSRKYVSGDKLTACLTPYCGKPMLAMNKRLNGDTLERYNFSGPEIDQLLAKLKTILKEAPELNDCDEDINIICDLQNKCTDTAKKLGNIQNKDIKYRQRIALFALKVSSILFLLALVVKK